ncbi:hypothetical protein HOM50_01045 [bacterium]|jgi:acylphosphatase|nr:hypothetical protein [bacterium]MBT5014977.1 hypothetical protein [bacterium]
MKQSVQIVLSISLEDSSLKDFIQKSAGTSGIEGMAFIGDPQNIQIVANGASDAVDKFIDLLYIGAGSMKPESLSVEPYLQVKDFRGIFRVIE